MRYSLIREMDISNGTGIGISLFVQGCHFHCDGCFNQETWDFNGGKEWNKQIENKFLALADKEFIERVSILGGEPLSNENVVEVYQLVTRIRKEHPNKKIWLYTGYTWEELNKPKKKLFNKDAGFYNNLRMLTIQQADVLCEGRFVKAKQDLYNEYSPWVGSTNQRVIKPYDSLINKRVVLFQ